MRMVALSMPLSPPNTPRTVLTPFLPWHSLQHRAGVFGVPVILQETWHRASFAGSQPAWPPLQPKGGTPLPSCQPHPSMGTLAPPWCLPVSPPVLLTMRSRLHCWCGPRTSFSR